MKNLFKKQFATFFFYIFFFILFIGSNFFIARNYVFTTLADNMTYLIGSESFYYDQDFIINKPTAERFIEHHEPITKKNFPPIISRKTSDQQYGVAKPIIFMMYFSFFTPIQNEVLRAQVANGILLFLWYVVLYFAVRKIKDTIKVHLLAACIFTLLLFVSQTNFYLVEVHPEIYINTLIIVASVPLLTQNTFKNNKYLYFFLGLIASIIFSAKQIALIFPLITCLYLFFSKKRQGFKPYFLGFLMGITVVISLYQNLYHSFTAYEGARGMIKLEENDMIFRQGQPANTFTFPPVTFSRVIEYLFGKNIGILIYNAPFVLFVLLFFYNLHKKMIPWVIFLPVFIYMAIYFGVVDPYFSYGGAASLGNRYFFQIYGYILVVTIITLLKLTKLKEWFTITAIIIPLILFSLMIYFPYYQFFPRAIRDHLIIPENKKMFSLLPIELSYAPLMYTDLPIENQIKGVSVINKGYPLLRDGEKYLLFSHETYIIDYADKMKKVDELLKTNGKIEMVKRNHHGISLYKITCDMKSQCYIL